MWPAVRSPAALAALLALAAAPAIAQESPAPAPPDPDARRFEPSPPRPVPPELAALPTRTKERSFLLPIGQKLLADAIIFSYAYAAGEEWTRVSLDTMEANLRGPWTFDPNHFDTNQIGHPYHGHLAFSAARAAGFGFWEAIPFPVVTSTLWELFAETEPPSINDGITTPVGGTFLGEVLYRLSEAVLDGGGIRPNRARVLAAGLVSPTVGLTHALTGNRYRTREAEPIPVAVEARFGGSFSGSYFSGEERSSAPPLLTGSIHVTHGLPVGDWRLREPFDHFDFTAAFVATEEPWVVLQVRGLMAGDDYGGGASRGFWGLWGLYDTTNFAPFRSSTSAVGFGTTGQWSAVSGLALRATAIGGLGFGAAGRRQGTELTPDYHYGLGSLVIVDGQLFAADRGAVRLTLRQYYVGGLVSPDSDGHESVAHATMGGTLRLIGRHAVGLEITRARHWSGTSDLPDTVSGFSQAIAYYAFLGDKTLGSGLRIASGAPR